MGAAEAVPGRLHRWATYTVLAVVPLLLAFLFSAVILALLGVDPVAYFGDIVTAGITRESGRFDVITRMAPILLIGCGLIYAFRASLWNLGTGLSGNLGLRCGRRAGRCGFGLRGSRICCGRVRGGGRHALGSSL